jgi:hypothetical protein
MKEIRAYIQPFMVSQINTDTARNTAFSRHECL